MGSVHSVGELTRWIRNLIAGDPILRSVMVRGEISNFNTYRSGHAYFTLKDKDAFAMTGVSDAVREILETTGFDQFLLKG